MRISVDIDNTTSRTAEGVVNMINERYGTNFTIDDITEWNPKLPYKDKPINYTKEYYRAFDTPGFIENAEIAPGAEKGIKRLLDRNNSVYLLTGRPVRYQGATANWARRIDPDLKVVHAPEGKQYHTKDFDLLLDDSDKEIRQVVLNGGKGVIIDKPWNKKFPRMYAKRVADWPEFNRVIDQKSYY
jgi:5'(3')-deoxyribonucleotidase